MVERTFSLDEILEGFADGALQVIITGTKRAHPWDFQPYFDGKEELTKEQFEERLPDIGDVLKVHVKYNIFVPAKSVTFERIEGSDTFAHTGGVVVE